MHKPMKHRIHRLRHRMCCRLPLVLGAAAVAAAMLAATPGAAFAQRDSLPVRELQTFTEIFGRIKQNYVEPVEDRQLIEDSIRGMLSGLDPHSAYLDPEAFRASRAGTSGRFGGLGIEVTMGASGVRVVAPIEGTPAYRAGIRTDDLIVRINKISTVDMNLQQAVNLLRGAPGTSVRLSVRRTGVRRPLVFNIERAVMRLRSVRSRMLEDRYGYVRLSRFQSDTVRSLYRALAGLKREAGGQLDGMVLDLRGNPGGVLSVAVDVAGAFLEEGTVVSTRGRGKDTTDEYRARPPDMIDKAPLVVLVNRGSASASEIVAGALQDHRRAVVLGERTFGKGSVQTIIPIGSDAALKLTTALYHTPNGRSIQARGIMPDVVVRNPRLAESGDEEGSREADLSGHLEDGDGAPSAAPAPIVPVAEDGAAFDGDVQLQSALNLLKGVHILGEPNGASGS